jgi:rSAM/selenodomain-associated transferase 2/rSAM/selenodomain-associated transferase 1
VTKTRLIGTLGADGAAELQRRLTEHTLKRLSPIMAARELDVELRYDGGTEDDARGWLGSSFEYRGQGGGSLGQRMARGFREGFSSGRDRVLIIGCDCPDLGPVHLGEAIAALGSSDLVLGPAADGGYYLIGLNAAAWHEAEHCLFEDIDWGTGAVLDQTLAAADSRAIRVTLLDELIDVDRPSDLHAWNKWEASRGRAQANGDSGSGPLISVIIPTLNEEAALGSCIDSLHGSKGLEVIVADGGSRDSTREIAGVRGARVVRAGPGRAVQMNAGAKEAAGEILLFLHADTSLPPRFDHAVREAMSDPDAVAGAFEFATDMDSLLLRLIKRMTGLRSRRLGITFGDQAIFVRSSEFRRLGGYPPQPIMEDYELVRRLRRRGRMVIVPRRAVTSARRWRANGMIRNTYINSVITAAYLLGFSPDSLHGFYRRMNRGYRV